MAAPATQPASFQQVPDKAGGLVPARRLLLPVDALPIDVATVVLALQQLLEVGPGENPEALQHLHALVSRLRRLLPEGHFREERLRDLATDFALWFSPAPRLKFDYNDEALRSMLQVDIHRLATSR